MARTAKTTALKDSSIASIGFEAKPWLAADKLFFSTQIPVCLWFSGKNEPAGKSRAASELEMALAA